MRIGIDIRCLSGGKRSGVEEYVLSLLPEIFKQDKKNKYILFLNSFKKSSLDLSWIEKYPNVTLKCTRLPNKLLNFSLWYFSWPRLDKLLGGVDYFFMPNISFAAFSKKTKLILTVHDLSFEYHPNFFSFKRRLWHFSLNPKKIARKAWKIISISESTKADLKNLYSIPQERIKTIHSGISEKFKSIDRNDSNLIRVKEKYNLPFNFILHLGTLEPRKNTSAIVLAFEKLKQEAKNDNHPTLSRLKLVLSGNPGWKSKKIKETIQNSPFKEDIIETNFIEEKDKVYLYNLASLFLFPSFLEGFGFPPLEAQACGLPVIVSNNSSFPETMDDSAIMIDPDRPEEIKQAIKEVLLNKEKKDEIKNKGFENSKNFSWEKSARKFIEILN